MSHINILIVDDDLNKISLIIKTIREVYSETLSINQAICVQEAIENLQKNEFHLLITDLQMPLKYDDLPDNNGGKSLIKEIYKKKNKVNVPMYIVGLTQFENLKETFEGVWKIWYFDSSSENWKINLRDLIHHIGLVNYRVKSNKIETLFVEGPTDKKIIECAFRCFYKQYLDKVYVETINIGGGASWVERQLIIWAKTLSKKSTMDSYIKAIGIFDDDEAGNIAINNIKKQIDENSAECNTFSIVKSSFKYSVLLKSIKKKGITFPTSIEDLTSTECWKMANYNCWLEKRNPTKIKIDQSILDLSNKELSIESLRKNHFSDDEILLITNKVKDDYKRQFCNLVCEGDKDALISINHLIKDILFKLKIIQIP